MQNQYKTDLDRLCKQNNSKWILQTFYDLVIWSKKIPKNNKICRLQIIGDNGNKYFWLFQKYFGNFTTVFFFIFKVARIMKTSGWANCPRQWQVEEKQKHLNNKNIYEAKIYMKDITFSEKEGRRVAHFSPVRKNILTTKIYEAKNIWKI